MIETIPVAHVLREAVATPYRNLVTRPTGAAVRGRIETVLAASACRTAVLDFSEVDLLDLSCADEVVAKLLRVLSAQLDRFVALRGLHEDLWEAIDAVLARQDLAVVVVRDDGPALLGSVPDDVREAFQGLGATRPTDAAGLAGHLGWPEPRAAAALSALVTLRLASQGPAGTTRLPLA